jgi:ribonuclease HI
MVGREVSHSIVRLYTDASVRQKEGEKRTSVGLGAVLVYDRLHREYRKGFRVPYKTATNKAEMMAVEFGLACIPEELKERTLTIHVISDNTYVVGMLDRKRPGCKHTYRVMVALQDYAKYRVKHLSKEAYRFQHWHGIAHRLSREASLTDGK